MLDKELEIIEKLENGETLTKISKEKGFPSLSQIYKCMRSDDALHRRITKAREVGSYSHLDKIQDMLSEPQDPKYFQQQREAAHHARWLASKLLSNTFGDKVKSEIKQDQKITISWKSNKKPEIENKAVETSLLAESK